MGYSKSPELNTKPSQQIPAAKKPAISSAPSNSMMMDALDSNPVMEPFDIVDGKQGPGVGGGKGGTKGGTKSGSLHDGMQGGSLFA